MTKLRAAPIMRFESSELFEDWLATHHDKSDGFWLKISRKGAKAKSVSYAEALDVALCYGWIDGQKQAYDEKAWLQRFCPRNAKSVWSKKNTEHIRRLIDEGRMKPSGLKVVERAKDDGTWDKAYDGQSKMTIPDDFLKELRKNRKAATFFKGLNKTNLFSIGFRLQTAKKQETRERRIRAIIEMLANGEKFH